MKVVNWLRLRHFLRHVVRSDVFWWISGAVALFLFGTLLSWQFWEQLHGKDGAVSTTIRNIALAMAAPIALVLAIWRSIVAERQVKTNSALY